MAAHVGAQGVAAGVRLALAAAVDPLARVLLLADADVLVVDVLDERVHVAQVAGGAALPAADGDLVGGLAAVVVVLGGAAEERGGGWGVGDVARGVGRDGGRGRRGRHVLVGRRDGSVAVPGGAAALRGRHVEPGVLGEVVRGDGRERRAGRLGHGCGRAGGRERDVQE